MAFGIGQFGRDEGGAVAATYSIALLGLIAIAGVGYDVARMYGLDSELQNAADQAAIAAATQLDKNAGACSRASSAAVGLLRNVTLLANDGNADGNTITFTDEAACDATGFIRFYQDKEKTTPATSDEEARYVEVRVNPRVARYALTPVGSSITNSGNLNAAAFAGVGSAICRVPPLKICNPAEPAGNTDVFLDFPVEGNVGAGIKLLGNETNVPGAFGFLQTEFGSGANGLLAALGWDVRGGDCVSVDGVEVQDGVVNSARDGINVRFDADVTGQYCPSINGVSGTCSPSVNSRKDLIRAQNSSNWEPYLGNTAATAHQFAYRPIIARTYASTFGAGTFPKIMGHPRDICHAWSDSGNCTSFTSFPSGLIGDGQWDIDAYWRSNFGAPYASQISAADYGAQPKGYPTRYQVYRWEADQILAGTLPGGVSKLATGQKYAYAQPQPGYGVALPNAPYGLVPGSDLDRRRMSVAVLNCNALQAKYGNSLNNKILEVGTWIDIFLVEPARARKRCQGGGGGGGSATFTIDGTDYDISCNDTLANQFEVYVELIGRTDIGGDNGSNLQTIRRDVPYLIE
ncbi:pilus assembly protein TadG-related protein [Alteriqipengyuania sp. WL0013]|uniref:pilus assembly protein TadG-related protein n=1 Tax=Alteriqipengyuania sp. WL0013 TaxID=3110773 RepID=UPI002BAFAE4B|nr:pilus assembly protein TadG-related protein [Alteriqipengyuania sp. WL0013]MEB3416408.1 pilus assembly protein TadG-related protein [Alteriqipengyuania sp. WL0013]